MAKINALVRGMEKERKSLKSGFFLAKINAPVRGMERERERENLSKVVVF